MIAGCKISSLRQLLAWAGNQHRVRISQPRDNERGTALAVAKQSKIAPADGPSLSSWHEQTVRSVDHLKSSGLDDPSQSGDVRVPPPRPAARV
jgi:hypothetical protein